MIYRLLEGRSREYIAGRNVVSVAKGRQHSVRDVEFSNLLPYNSHCEENFWYHQFLHSPAARFPLFLASIGIQEW